MTIKPPSQTVISQQVELALREDIGSGDVSSSLIDKAHISRASVITRDEGILSGKDWFEACFTQLDNNIDIKWHVKDGDKLHKEAVLCNITGPAHVLVTAERTALNFLQLLSGVATHTHRFVERIAHTQARVLDTRKTIPGLRLAQKYAVTCGGGLNHRIGLFDAIMLKENHLYQFNSIREAIETAREQHPDTPIIVEVETLQQLELTLALKPTQILLDNFSLEMLKQAVEMTQHAVPLEASGNVSLDTIKEIADTGVDYISVGEVTKKVVPLDLSMRLQ